jgi:NADH:ubiquinone oxidoreductase subunit K
VRIYSASSEETLRARKLLADWEGEGYLTQAQYQLLKQETVSELRTTNIYLRLVLFLFTLIIVGAAAALFFVVFLSHPSEQTDGVVFLIFAAVCYAAAEAAVSQARLYRYGVEEALAVCSVAFLCAGIQFALFSGSLFSAKPDAAQSIVPAAGAVFSLWIWHRCGLSYAFLAAMIFVVFLPGYWTSSPSAQHGIVAVFYAAGLAGASAVRSRHRFDYLDESYSLVAALLWLGIYLAINLQLQVSSLRLIEQWWGSTRADSEFARPFYWTTWVLIWCLPPIILARGIRQKDRFVIASGTIAAILTLACNKPYLGWQRHTWDPMLLGILLTGVAVFIRRWLARGPGGIRHGFTAERLSGKDKHWMDVGSTALGLVSPDSLTPSPQASSDFRFGGGQSGGGGASSNF